MTRLGGKAFLWGPMEECFLHSEVAADGAEGVGDGGMCHYLVFS